MTDKLKMNRREAIAAMTSSIVAMSTTSRADERSVSTIVENHDTRLKQAMDAQVTDTRSRWCGAGPDQWGLYHCHSAGRILRDGAAAFFHPESQFYKSQKLFERMELATGFLLRSQSKDGNIDLVTTNFNSPPDTGFVVHDVATAAKLAQIYGHQELLNLLKGFLERAGYGMARGGIHTPNHRWVVGAALAQIHDLFPDEQYLKRIDQWLAEGIDIDEEGQYIERSTTVYNAVSDNALVVMAHKLMRPELLDPVRKNLNAMAYLLHPTGEVVTEISRRQDLNTRGTMARYWFSLRYMAVKDQNGLYASMLQFVEPDHIHLSALMEYPELQKALPAPTSLPDHYEKQYPLSNVTRIRRGKTSITIMHKRNSRWISIHHGRIVVNAIRFASAFFGKGQFVPDYFEKRKGEFHFRQELQAPYYQPLTDVNLLPVHRSNWSSLASKRQRTEINRMIYETKINERPDGLDVVVSATGTDNVPLALEINLRKGGELKGVVAATHVDEAFLLKSGYAEYRMGSDIIRFGPGQCEHAYTQVRGAHDKLTGPSVYITGYTPFQYTLNFELL